MRFEPSAPFDQDLLARLPEVTAIERHGPIVQVSGAGDLVNAVILTLAAAGVTAHDVELDTTSLEDAFVAYTGPQPGASPPAPGPTHRESGHTAKRAAPGRSRHPTDFSRTAPRSGFAKLVSSEARLAWRWPIGLLFGLGLPVLLLVLFGLLPAFHQHRPKLGGLSYFDVYVPTLIALVAAALALFSLPTPLATYREQGILRRLSTTPVPPSWVLGAQLVVQLAIAALALMILMVVGTVGFGLEAPVSLGGFILAAALTISAVFADGAIDRRHGQIRSNGRRHRLGCLFPAHVLRRTLGSRPRVSRRPAGRRELHPARRTSTEALQHAISEGFPTGSYPPRPCRLQRRLRVAGNQVLQMGVMPKRTDEVDIGHGIRRSRSPVSP